MTRPTNTEDLDKLMATVSVQRLAESKGVKLRKNGNLFTGTCPFHSSKKQTLEINPTGNTWTCSGKCKIKNGSVIDWIIKSEGVSKKHAIELLKSDFGTETVKPSKGKNVGSQNLSPLRRRVSQNLSPLG